MFSLKTTKNENEFLCGKFKSLFEKFSFKFYQKQVLFLFTLAAARPESGYNYNAPNLGISSGFVGGSGGFGGGSSGSVGFGGDLGGGGGYGGSFESTNGASSGFVGGGFGSSRLNNDVSIDGSSSSRASSSAGRFEIEGGFGGGTLQSSVGGGGGSFSGDAGFGGRQQIIQKHIYVHTPPPEPEEAHYQQHLASGGVAQKHYKIIFIKAPFTPQLSTAQLALATQSQEKTIVYVLVKKPDEYNGFSVPGGAPAIHPSKPEVYFIKYKSQKDNSGGRINGLGADTSSIGVEPIASGPADSANHFIVDSSSGQTIGSGGKSQFISSLFNHKKARPQCVHKSINSRSSFRMLWYIRIRHSPHNIYLDN